MLLTMFRRLKSNFKKEIIQEYLRDLGFKPKVKFLTFSREKEKKRERERERERE